MSYLPPPPLNPFAQLDLKVQKHLLEEWLRNTRYPEGHILVSLKRLHLREINQKLLAPDMQEPEYNELCDRLNLPQL